jgi:hypothetical protein
VITIKAVYATRVARWGAKILCLGVVLAMAGAATAYVIRDSGALTDITFTQIEEDLAHMTEYQRTQAAQRYIGKIVRWRGWVNDVKTGKTLPLMYVSMNGAKGVMKVYFEVTDRSNAELSRGTPILFQGTIQRVYYARSRSGVVERIRVMLTGVDIEEIDEEDEGGE